MCPSIDTPSISALCLLSRICYSFLCCRIMPSVQNPWSNPLSMFCLSRIWGKGNQTVRISDIMSGSKSTPVFLALMLILSGCLGGTEPGINDVIDTIDGGGLSDNSTIDNYLMTNSICRRAIWSFITTIHSETSVVHSS